MKRSPVTAEDLQGVFAVPPLAREDGTGRLAADQNDRLLRHVLTGGVTRVLYGGNAFLYHSTMAEYEALLDWMSGVEGDVWMIPALGPSYGRAMDQARLLRGYAFPTAMLLPCSDPRDAAGLEGGVRQIADVLGRPLVLYLKEETTFGEHREAGADAVGRLVRDETCVAIKYAVVRKDPSVDPCLEGLLARVDRERVVSGIGERPAVVHMRQWRLPGFTTGSGCIAPRLSSRLFDACRGGDFAAAEEIRRLFLRLEDVRDAEGPARTLHAAVGAAGLAQVGPIPPFVSPLPPDACAKLEPIARALLAENVRALCEA